jgi:hypothetical protein
MQADFAVELGPDVPALEIPWHSNDPQVRYYDLKSHPELVQQLPEAQAYPELASFLSRINAPGFSLTTAKCDAWSTSEVTPEEEIFGDRKFVSYIDLVFVDQEDRCSFEKHEVFVKELCRLLSHAPEIPAAVELVIRHCYYHQEEFVSEISNEPDGSQSSATMRAPEISSSQREDVMDHDPEARIAIDDELSPVKEHYERLDAKAQDNPRDIAAQCKPARAMDHVEPHNLTEDVQANATDLNHLVRITKHEFANGREQQQSSSRESERADLLPGHDLFKMPLSGKSSNLPPEHQPQIEGATTSVTGFCLTAYVTGFGDVDHDPVRRWAIGLHLLQNAIVQLNANSQSNH